MTAVGAQEASPEIGVLLAGEPFLLPAEYPAFLHGIDHVFRIGVDRHVAAFEFQHFEGYADGQQLHAVVGRQAVTLRHLLAEPSRYQDRSVTTRTGIAQGRAVGIDGDFRHSRV